MKYISERISFHRHDEYTTILISTKVEKWKESLLYGWLMLWVLVGIAIAYVLVTGNYLNLALDNTPKNQLQLFLIIFLVFWAYYLYNVQGLQMLFYKPISCLWSNDRMGSRW